MPTPRLTLEIEPVGDASWAAVPVEVRLRRLLRAAVRSYGLRVKLIAPVKPKRRPRKRTKAKAA